MKRVVSAIRAHPDPKVVAREARHERCEAAVREIAWRHRMVSVVVGANQSGTTAWGDKCHSCRTPWPCETALACQEALGDG